MRKIKWKKDEPRILPLYIEMFFFLISDIVLFLTYGDKSVLSYYLARISVFIYLFCEPLILLTILALIKHNIGKKISGSISEFLMSLCFSMAFAVIILIIIAPFAKMFYYISGKNNYHTKPNIAILYILYIVIMVLTIVIIIINRKIIENHLMCSLIVYLAFCLPAAIIENLINVNIGNLALTLSCIITFILYELHETQSQILYKSKIESMQMNLKISQIRPHFIHNSLTSIIYLVDKDPPEAKKALMNFSDYLRTNLDFTNKQEVITFESEFNHVKVYLSLEKLRFEDDLNIVYDINDTNFKIPILTVQPLVENAVKHGIHKSENGCGTVTISTHADQNNHVITISDDGAGFNTAILEDLDESHIGIANVRYRLKEKVNGTLSIKSTIDSGTVCTITIPRGESIENTRNR